MPVNIPPLKNTAKRIPFYLILLPVFSILDSYNDLFGFIPILQILSFLLLSYAIAGVIYLIAWLCFRNASISAITTFMALLIILFFGPYHDFIKQVTKGSFLSSYKILVPVTILAITLLVRYLVNRKAALNNTQQYLTVVMAILCIVELFKTTVNLLQLSKTGNLIYSQMHVADQYRPCNLSDSSKPDIYFIVFDEYTNNQTLRTIWNFNNDSITNWLAQKGFYIATNSRANYDFTPFSISSTFNMNYIDEKNGVKGNSPLHILQAVKSMSHNETYTVLKKENYTFRFLAPFNSPLEDIGLLHEFGDFPAKKLFNHTLPGRVHRDILWNFTSALSKPAKTAKAAFAYDNWQKRTEDVHTTIEKIKSTTDTVANRKPRFVYGHLMVAHPPHLFNADGTGRPDEDISFNKGIFDTYTQQIAYANKIIQELVTHIQQTNKKNTIIIIEGDHGFRQLPDSLNKYNFPNFNTIYFPDQNYRQLYKEMSPVNTFRVIFNHYFCQSLAMLKDTSIKVKY